MTHPDMVRGACRPPVAELVETLAERHRIAVHSVLRGESVRHLYARSELCHMLAGRGWYLDAIERWFGFTPGTASAGVARWAKKLQADAEFVRQARDFEAAGEGLPPIRERMAALILPRSPDRPCIQYPEAVPEERMGSAARPPKPKARPHIVEAPKPRKHREKPLTATVLESSLMAHGIAQAKLEPAPRCVHAFNYRGTQTCTRPVVENGLCKWHAAAARPKCVAPYGASRTKTCGRVAGESGLCVWHDALRRRGAEPIEAILAAGQGADGKA